MVFLRSSLFVQDRASVIIFFLSDLSTNVEACTKTFSINFDISLFRDLSPTVELAIQLRAHLI